MMLKKRLLLRQLGIGLLAVRFGFRDKFSERRLLFAPEEGANPIQALIQLAVNGMKPFLQLTEKL